jgi:Domain of unknown function (DUF4349)
MKSLTLLALLISVVVVSACDRSPLTARRAEPNVDSQAPASLKEIATTKTSAKQSEVNLTPQSPAMQQVSLNQAQHSQSMQEAMNRKILRNADLTLEVSDPASVQRKITSIAESLGGFVVLSESKQQPHDDSGRTDLIVNVVVRVPAMQFDAALNEIRAQGGRVIDEKNAGQDVTEEFIDLEARIKTQRALESQFLEIMKQARKVEDALEVQRQVANVRTEIEKLEGRKRFLENRASLSTITVKLQTPAAIVVTTSGFGRKVREATADSVSIASEIVLFLIRFVFVMVPIFILIILPGGLLARYLFRRAKRWQLSPEANSSSAK